MSDNVISIGCMTKLPIPPEKVLNAAREKTFERVTVIGVCEDGEEYVASSTSDCGAILWDMERLAGRLMRAPDHEGGDNGDADGGADAGAGDQADNGADGGDKADDQTVLGSAAADDGAGDADGADADKDAADADADKGDDASAQVPEAYELKVTELLDFCTTKITGFTEDYDAPPTQIALVLSGDKDGKRFTDAYSWDAAEKRTKLETCSLAAAVLLKRAIE